MASSNVFLIAYRDRRFDRDTKSPFSRISLQTLPVRVCRPYAIRIVEAPVIVTTTLPVLRSTPYKSRGEPAEPLSTTRQSTYVCSFVPDTRTGTSMRVRPLTTARQSLLCIQGCIDITTTILVFCTLSCGLLSTSLCSTTTLKRPATNSRGYTIRTIVIGQPSDSSKVILTT